MNRKERGRHFIFFSTSLTVHVIIVLAAVALLTVVSDAPSADSNRPLMVSLDRIEETGSSLLKDQPYERTRVPENDAPRSDTDPVVAENEIDTAEKENSEVSSSLRPGVGSDPAELAGYIRSVRKKIERHKRYPMTAARDNVEGTVTVSFLLDRSGNLLEKSIVAGSGYSILDAAALATIVDSSPFPAFPDSLNRETLLLRLPINYRQR